MRSWRKNKKQETKKTNTTYEIATDIALIVVSSIFRGTTRIAHNNGRPSRSWRTIHEPPVTGIVPAGGSSSGIGVLPAKREGRAITRVQGRKGCIINNISIFQIFNYFNISDSHTTFTVVYVVPCNGYRATAVVVAHEALNKQRDVCNNGVCFKHCAIPTRGSATGAK